MRLSISSMAMGLSATFAALATAMPGSTAHLDKRYTEKRNGVNYNVFEHAGTSSKLSYVHNSGICETTAGVNQYSGYISVGNNMNMFFWFFEARHSPTTAPLAAWFNGGPGCSSMIGLFQENGPCQFYNGSSEPSLNPYSFNNFANMLYIDQPVGVGFSYGNDSVDSTVSAAPQVWALLQSFYTQFPQYESRDFGIFTESYGGHYGPEFASYIQVQNAQIAAKNISGEPINLVAVGINNGWFDAKTQYRAYVDYSANNSYNQILSPSQYAEYMDTFDSDCAPAVDACYGGGDQSDDACSKAQDTCTEDIENAIISGADFDPYDVRQPEDDPYPPGQYTGYLAKQSVMDAIGAQTQFTECPTAAFNKFSSTGDNTRSFLSTLSAVVQSGVQVLVWAGDADWICNHMGVAAVADSVDFAGADEFRSKDLQAYKVNGKETGRYKTVGNFTYLQVYAAGHEVPYYQPETALQVFTQTMQKKGITST
ncbi:carboxypeptidase S1 [Apiospora saccharicola]|uniref:Carboxypeptidase n=1 Tax=Apiospora saccharicola TaxID=335842 RepID=A0ABR1TGS5_9PEZI